MPDLTRLVPSEDDCYGAVCFQNIQQKGRLRSKEEEEGTLTENIMIQNDGKEDPDEKILIEERYHELECIVKQQAAHRN